MPKKTAGYTHAKADQRKNKKRIAAEARQREYDSTPIEVKIKNMGKKELAKHEKKQKEKKVVAAPTPVPEVKPEVKKKTYQKVKKS